MWHNTGSSVTISSLFLSFIEVLLEPKVVDVRKVTFVTEEEGVLS